MNWWKVLICLGLAVCCVGIYGQTLSHEFVNYDDGLYVTNNPHVQAGLSWKSLAWSFVNERAMYFHPLTWLSHILDCELYGLDPWGHHLTNLIFHTLSSILLFLVFARITEKMWLSALIAALFAVHPLHVESVAWVAERKDVLSMLFWTAAIGVYASCRNRSVLSRNAATASMFFFGFMSKPMVVTLPFVLLLLDYWPLERIDRTASIGAMAKKILWLTVEKIPLFLMTAAMCAITMIMQMRGDNLAFAEKVPFLARCGNAIVVYVLYLCKTVWPLDLAVYYPHPLSRPLWQIAGAAMILLVISIFSLYQARKRPYLIVGWLWYLGTLVPVIEIVQAGSFSHADRYTYIPLVGIFVMAAWGLNDLGSQLRVPRPILAFGAVAAVLALSVCAVNQTHYWRNSMTLFQHALDVTADNPLAHNNIGVWLYDRKQFEEAGKEFGHALALDPLYVRAIDNQGVIFGAEKRYEEAEAKHREALAINPNFLAGRVNLAYALSNQGKYEASEAEYRQALLIDPESVSAYCGLGKIWAARGNADEAAAALKKALEINPRDKEANLLTGKMLAERGKFPEALKHYETVRRVDSHDTEAVYNLGVVMEALNRSQEAISMYRDALRLNPSLAQAHNNLAGLLVGVRQIDEALIHYRKAVELDPNYPEAHNNLANVLVSRGQTDEAMQHYEKALEIKPDYINARLNIANLLYQTRRYDEALIHLQGVLDKHPDNKDARQFMSEIEAAKNGRTQTGNTVQ